MKRISYVWLAGIVVAGALALSSQAQDQSLGSYARAVRKDKQGQQASAKKYDNDNLPKNDVLSVVGNTPAEPAEKTGEAPATGDQATPNAEPKPEKTETSAADQQKMIDDWKTKIGTQKNQIDLMSRELDVLQREYRLRAASFYADAGNRLRNQGSWDKEDQQYKQQIDQKQKALGTAKQQLSDMQEGARKAGVPTSARE
jgi:uncharacterized coiled-coil protein SlyX